MAVLGQLGPVLRSEKEDVLDRKADASDQYLSLSKGCVVGDGGGVVPALGARSARPVM